MSFFSSFFFFPYKIYIYTLDFLGFSLAGCVSLLKAGSSLYTGRHANRDCLPQIILTPVIFFFLKKDFEYSQMVILESRKMKGK